MVLRARAPDRLSGTLHDQTKCGDRLQPGIGVQDPVLQVLKGRCWFRADLGDERGAEPLVGVKGFALPPGAVEREHELGMCPLSQRVLRRPDRQARGDFVVPPQCEARVEKVLRGRAPLLMEAFRP